MILVPCISARNASSPWRDPVILDGKAAGSRSCCWRVPRYAICSPGSELRSRGRARRVADRQRELDQFYRLDSLWRVRLLAYPERCRDALELFLRAVRDGPAKFELQRFSACIRQHENCGLPIFSAHESVEDPTPKRTLRSALTAVGQAFPRGDLDGTASVPSTAPRRGLAARGNGVRGTDSAIRIQQFGWRRVARAQRTTLYLTQKRKEIDMKIKTKVRAGDSHWG